MNVIASDLLSYDNTTGAVRSSIADVRQQRQVPASIIPLQVTRLNEFDRLVLLALDQFLTEKKIPALFLQSNYFTLRAQLQQAYQEDPTRFRGKLEQVSKQLEAQVWRDYSTLVNESNRIYVSRFPFQKVALNKIRLTSSTPGFARFRVKLKSITQSDPNHSVASNSPFDLLPAY